MILLSIDVNDWEIIIRFTPDYKCIEELSKLIIIDDCPDDEIVDAIVEFLRDKDLNDNFGFFMKFIANQMTQIDQEYEARYITDSYILNVVAGLPFTCTSTSYVLRELLINGRIWEDLLNELWDIKVGRHNMALNDFLWRFRFDNRLWTVNFRSGSYSRFCFADTLLFTMTVMVSEGSLGCVVEEGPKTKTQRFFAIASQLPIELQGYLCTMARAPGWDRTYIPANEIDDAVAWIVEQRPEGPAVNVLGQPIFRCDGCKPNI